MSDDKKILANGFVELNNRKYYHIQIKSYEDLSILVGVNRKDFNSALLTELLPKILNTIFLSFLFLILLYFVKVILLKPVLALSNCAKQISLGNLDINLPQSNIYEIDILANSIDRVRNIVLKEEKNLKMN